MVRYRNRDLNAVGPPRHPRLLAFVHAGNKVGLALFLNVGIYPFSYRSQCPQSIHDHSNVYRLLEKSPMQGWKVPEGGSDHPGERKAKAGEYALSGDMDRPLGNA